MHQQKIREWEINNDLLIIQVLMDDDERVIVNIPGMQMQLIETHLNEDTGITNVTIPVSVLTGIDSFDVLLVKKETLGCVSVKTINLFSTKL